MSPSRVAAMVLVVYVLLPIRSDVFATVNMPVWPDSWQVSAVLAAPQLGVAPSHPTPLVREEAIIPSEERERYVRHAKLKCLYIDWFYDTGGLWVSTDGTHAIRDAQSAETLTLRGA